MSKYILTNQATQDLSDIGNYTYNEHSEKQADQYYFKLIEVFESLAMDSNMGKEYFHIYEDLRG